MSLAELLPIIMAAAATGLTCGMACGTCGNPMTNVFLASYLFTHAGHLKRSVFSFASFYVGKILAVVMLCVTAAWLGNRIVDDAGLLFGFNMHFFVQVLMFGFALFLIGRWVLNQYRERTRIAGCNSNHACNSSCNSKKRTLPLFVCGFISGAAPCAPLIMAVGYASALSVADAVVVGVVFSVASSLLPLLVLVVLTGLLSAAMFREIPNKIRYFQLGAYVLIAVMSGNALFMR